MRVTFSTSRPIGLTCQRGHLEIVNSCATRLSRRLSTGGGITALGGSKTSCKHLRSPRSDGGSSESANRGSQRLLSQRVQGTYLEDMASLPSKLKCSPLFAETVTV